MADGTAQPKLTTKQKLFLDYLLGECQYNATAAARKAGYKYPNVEGTRLLATASIQAQIDDIFAEVGMTRSMSIGMTILDATRTDEDILAMAGKAPTVPASASIASGLISARTTARTNLLRVNRLLADRVDVKHSGRVDHVHRMPQGLSNLTEDELDKLEEIGRKAREEREALV
jgi:phage terminase small subunit